MTEIRKVPLKEVLMGKLEHGGDLLEQLNRICGEQKITLGRVEAMGAVKEARLGFYNQRKREYEFTNIYKPLEVLWEMFPSRRGNLLCTRTSHWQMKTTRFSVGI